MFLFSAAITTENRNKLTAARAGRLRTDLGGLYFNLIGILALAGLYAATNAEILLLAIAVIQLEMLEQLLPFARFDGYWILSDLGGVPDLFARIPPILKNAVTRGDTRTRGSPACGAPPAPRLARQARCRGLRHRAGPALDGTGPVPRLVTTPPAGFARRLLRREGGSG